jgi:hypothetical protein
MCTGVVCGGGGVCDYEGEYAGVVRDPHTRTHARRVCGYESAGLVIYCYLRAAAFRSSLNVEMYTSNHGHGREQITKIVVQFNIGPVGCYIYGGKLLLETVDVNVVETNANTWE